MKESTPTVKARWINRTVVGIILATFLSDVSHEMATAVMPLYLASLSLGPMVLGLMEGLADLLMSLSRLAGGVVGHHVRRKRPWTALGYLTTTLATSSLALVHGLAALVSLRGIAWIGRGFRSPLRDFMPFTLTGLGTIRTPKPPPPPLRRNDAAAAIDGDVTGSGDPPATFLARPVVPDPSSAIPAHVATTDTHNPKTPRRPIHP